MEKIKSSKVLNIVADIVFVPVMILLVVYLVYGLSVSKNNGVPSFFGQSYVRILSGSMKASGFNEMDVAMIKKVDVTSIKVDDIIAFYSCDETPSDYSGSAENATHLKTGKTSYDSNIVFHQVIDINYDSEGNVWFTTWGTSNPKSATELSRGDYVVGVYKDSITADFIQFLSSKTGLIIMIIVPSCLCLFLLLLNIIDIVDKMIKENKLKKNNERAHAYCNVSCENETREENHEE